MLKGGWPCRLAVGFCVFGLIESGGTEGCVDGDWEE